MVKQGARCALILALVLVLAACGTSGKKKKRRGSDDRSTATATATSTASRATTERVTVSPALFTMREDLTLAYEGCRSGQEVEFGWRDQRTNRSGVFAAAAPCSNGTATVRLRQFSGPSAGKWEVTGRIVSTGSRQVASLTTRAALVSTPQQVRVNEESTISYYGCEPGRPVPLAVRGGGPDSTRSPVCGTDGTAAAKIRHGAAGAVTVTAAQPDGTPLTSGYTVR
jgi:hypothetical protein